MQLLTETLCTVVCYTEKAPNAWHRRGTQKTGNTYNQPKRPSTGTTHRPSTRHYRKGSPGVKTHNTNQHSIRARLQHSNHPPSLPTPNRVITRSSQPTQPATKRKRAEPHYSTDTTRLSGDTQRPHGDVHWKFRHPAGARGLRGWYACMTADLCTQQCITGESNMRWPATS